MILVLGFTFGLTVTIFSWPMVIAKKQSQGGAWHRSQRGVKEFRSESGLSGNTSVWRLDETALKRVFLGAVRSRDVETMIQRDGTRIGDIELQLPMPDGSLAGFRIEEAPVIKPELAARFPEIRSYRGWGVDDPSLTMRCDLSPLGFHATVTDGVELMAIHPVSRDDREHYVSYASKDYQAAAEAAMCLVNEAKIVHRITLQHSIHSSVGGNLRKYEVAIATTSGFTNAYGSGTLAGASAAIATVLGSLNAIYERELSIQFVLAGALQNPSLNDAVISRSDNFIPFTDGNADAMVNEVRGVLRDRIGVANYDLGLVLGTGGSSGTAYVGVVCETASDVSGPYKGGGAVLFTGAPVNNPGSVALMAHEIGHQFGATHTHNANGCNATRVGDTAVESGSGMTLMSAANGCNSDNIAAARSANFHSTSFEQIVGYLNVLGGNCATLSASGNNPPAVDGGADYVIPKQTPLTLTATGSDPDGDVLTYSWEQVDAGGTSFSNPPYHDAGDPAQTTRPIFRPFDPVSNPSRTFPILSDILSGQNAGTFEMLPQVTRAMNFRVTARDGRSGNLGGGVSNDSVRVDVDGIAGPFRVTSHNSNVTWIGGEQQDVTWSVNGTNNAGSVNCQSVKIRLSTDSGNNFPYDLTPNNVANNGSATIRMPAGLNLTLARIKVEAVGNIFFDISDTNFTLTPGCSTAINSTTQNFSAGFNTGTVGVTAATGCFWAAISNAPWIVITSGATGTSNGVVNYSVTTNPGTLRTGTMTVAGQTFTVTQAGGIVNGLQFYPLPAPVRLLDTRSGVSGCVTGTGAFAAGSTRTEPARTACSTIPSSAAVVTGNITVVPAAAGFVTLFPADAAQPSVANSNFKSGEVTNNFFTVGLGATGVDAGAFKIFTTAATDVIIDLTGYYAPPGANGLYYHPLSTPVRLVQTFPGQTGCFANPTVTQLQGTNDPNANPALDLVVDGRGAGLPSPCNIIPSDAVVLVGNATTVFPNAPLGFGYLTVYPSGATRPTVASSNYGNNDIINGPFAVKLGADGKFKVYTFSTTHLVIDISGYYSASAVDANGAGLLFNPLPSPMRLLETRNIPGFPLVGCSKPQAPIAGGTGGIRTQQVWGTCSDQPITIPNSSQAIVGNVTAINPTGAGFGTFFPGNVGTAPTVAVTNYPFPAVFGYNRHYYVGLSPTDGTFKILTQFTSDYIVDVSGYFAP